MTRPTTTDATVADHIGLLRAATREHGHDVIRSASWCQLFYSIMDYVEQGGHAPEDELHALAGELDDAGLPEYYNWIHDNV